MYIVIIFYIIVPMVFLLCAITIHLEITGGADIFYIFFITPMTGHFIMSEYTTETPTSKYTV